jgi:transcriptional regulator with XRE-family HTH domain
MTTTTAERDVNTAVSRVVKILLAYRRETQAALAVDTGLSKPTLIRRMAGERSWTAAEVAALARHFGVPEQVFYDGPDALVGHSSPVTDGYSTDTARGFSEAA